MAAMKVRPPLIACFAGLLGGAVAAWAGEPVDVTYAGGLLTIRCAEAQLADVLEQVGSATGMALVLDDAVKDTPLTANIEAQPVHVALERLLEGQGVSYAMSLSPDGRKVAQMYVGAEPGAKSSASPAVGRARPPVLGVPGGRRPEPAAPPVAPIALGVPDDDDEVDAELGDDVSPFAGFAAEMPALPSSPLSPAGVSAAAGRTGTAGTPVVPVPFAGTGGGAAYYPVLDPFGRPIPIPQATPAPPADPKPTAPVNQ
jgi:hypothetical protein